MTFTGGRVRHGLAWSLSARIGTQLVQFGLGVVLARLLTPAEFGTIGMLLVFGCFAQLLADSGLGAALIHAHEIDETDIATVFWIQLAIGAALTIGFFAAAGPIARFFGEPRLVGLSRAMASVFVIQALGQIHLTMLRRAGRFTYLGVTSIASVAASGAIAVMLAAMGYGAWALLWQVVLAASFSTVTLWLGHRWMPRPIFSVASARALGSYGLFLLGNTGLGYWLRNGDNLLIGRLLGSVDLGLYSRAYNLMLLPVNNIAAVSGQVMFPALARLRDDRPAFHVLFLKAVRTIAFVSFPAMAGVALLSRPIVLILFGAKWAAMIPILQILSVTGLYQAAIYPVGWVYAAIGRTRAQFLLSLALVAAFAIAMATGLRFGVIGVTWGYAAWSVLSAALNLVGATRIVALPLRTVLGSVARIAAATAIMSAIVFALDRVMGPSVPLLASASLCAIVGVAVYLGACGLLREPTLDLLRGCRAR